MLAGKSTQVEPGTKSVGQIQAPTALAYEGEAKRKSEEQTEDAKEREKTPSQYETKTPEQMELERMQKGMALGKMPEFQQPEQIFAQQHVQEAAREEIATPQETGLQPLKLGPEHRELESLVNQLGKIAYETLIEVKENPRPMTTAERRIAQYASVMVESMPTPKEFAEGTTNRALV